MNVGDLCTLVHTEGWPYQKGALIKCIKIDGEYYQVRVLSGKTKPGRSDDYIRSGELMTVPVNYIGDWKKVQQHDLQLHKIYYQIELNDT